jgi:hypothetical protein
MVENADALPMLAWMVLGALVACVTAVLAIMRSGRAVPLLGGGGFHGRSSRRVRRTHRSGPAASSLSGSDTATSGETSRSDREP